MLLSDLSLYLAKLEKTASRNDIASILAEVFKKSTPEEIDKIVYLILGQLAPNYEGVVLNLAEKMMWRVIAQAAGTEIEAVRILFKKEGDLGNVAYELIKGRGSLSVTEVHKKLLEIAWDGGAQSQERKVANMALLLQKMDPVSAKYIARIPVGKLRLGFSDMTILDALSVMLKGDKSARPEIEAAFNVNVDPGRIARLIKEKGLSGIKAIVPVPGIPIRASLCERLPSAEKILEKVGKRVYVEPKYDGVRTELHLWHEKGEKMVRIFSRNLENTTAMFPDLVAAAESIKVESAIFDGEALAYDAKNDRFLPFQETIQRKRKHGIDEAVKDVPLKLFLFDILSKNGKNLLNLPFSERRKILQETITQNAMIQVTRQEETDSAETIRDLIKKYLSEGLEGAVIKKIDASYKAGARGYHWVKYKKTTDKGVADTIDCLVMGVNKGKGKRTGFGVGAFLVGIKDGDKFKTVSKIGTGLTDDQWREIYIRSKKLESKEQSGEYDVPKNLRPDVWMKSGLVVEILADEITKSPLHTAGLALRFPRLIKFRDDKNPDQITTLKELQKLYEMQKS